MANIWVWSKTPATNASVDSAINWAEGQSPGSVNDSARNVMAAVAEMIDDVGGALVTGGAADVQTLTTNVGITALRNGIFLSFKAGFTNTGAATLNVDGTGAKALRLIASGADAALSAGFITAGNRYLVQYDTTANSAAGGWIVVAGTQPNIPADSVTFAKIQNIATARLLGRTTASSGDVEELTAGNGLTLAAGVLAVSGLRLIAVQSFTATGTYTRTAGVTAAYVELIGPGGGGGGAIGSDLGVATGARAAGGGGAGGYASGFILSGLGAFESVVLPAGGAGGNTAGSNGVAGSGSSQFGTFFTCGAGAGGSGAPLAATVDARGSPGGAGGTASTSGVSAPQALPGRAGDGGIAFGVFPDALSGAGATSVLGSGGSSTGGAGAGAFGSGFGSGGAGACSNGGFFGFSGGNGTGGACYVWEFG